MLITRRQFTITTCTTIALTVVGCDDTSGQVNTEVPSDQPSDSSRELGKKNHPDSSGEPGKKNRHASKLAKEPFLIGPPTRYRPSGVYLDHEDKGVWLVSDGQRLVALNSTCTHLGCATKYKQVNSRFACPCHKSQFDLEGNVFDGSKAKRPLERCALRLVGGQVEVDPTRRFRKDRDEWSDPDSVFHLG